MLKTSRLASAFSQANNMSLQAGVSTHTFSDEEIPPGMSKSALKNRLKLEMANCFLDYNLQVILQVLSRIKQCESFDYSNVRQEFLPAPPAVQAQMSITFLNQRQAIRVQITLKCVSEPITAKSRRKAKHIKLIDTIEYLEEAYKDL